MVNWISHFDWHFFNISPRTGNLKSRRISEKQKNKKKLQLVNLLNWDGERRKDKKEICLSKSAQKAYDKNDNNCHNVFKKTKTKFDDLLSLKLQWKTIS